MEIKRLFNKNTTAMKRIVILQTQFEDLQAILESISRIDSKKLKDISFIQNPEQAIEQADEFLNVVVISGGMFYNSSLTVEELAQMVKEKNSRATFIVYSTVDEGMDMMHIDGVFPKPALASLTDCSGVHDAVAEFICKCISFVPNRPVILEILKEYIDLKKVP